ncbi:MAG: hypothetical protein R3C54_10635 [Parvularculaceae bacterium]
MRLLVILLGLTFLRLALLLLVLLASLRRLALRLRLTLLMLTLLMLTLLRLVSAVAADLAEAARAVAVSAAMTATLAAKNALANRALHVCNAHGRYRNSPGDNDYPNSHQWSSRALKLHSALLSRARGDSRHRSDTDIGAAHPPARAIILDVTPGAIVQTADDGNLNVTRKHHDDRKSRTRPGAHYRATCG